MEKNIKDVLMAAFMEVREFGLINGREMLIAIDAKGNILGRNYGTANSCGLPDGVNPLDLKGGHIVHDHPKLEASLSFNDLMASTVLQCTTHAITDSGAVFSSSGFDCEKVGPGALQFAMEVLGQELMRATFADTTGPFQHAINLALQKRGILKDYFYTMTPEANEYTNIGIRATNLINSLLLA